MTKLMIYYRSRKDWFLSRHPHCAGHKDHTHAATEIHHSRGRSGTLLLDERFWIPVCSGIHFFIHDEPVLARIEKLLCAKGDWNNAPADEETKRLRQLMKDLTHGTLE